MLAEYTMTSLPAELLTRLQTHAQEHVLHGWDTLDAAARAELVRTLAVIDLTELESLWRATAAPATVVPEGMQPAPITPPAYTAEEKARGEESLRRGEVAVLLVAGGQATRLKTPEPKGMFPAGPVSGASLFQIHAEKVFALSRRYRKRVPLLVMTSPATDTPSRAFFAEHKNFGLASEQVTFFQQGTMPAVCPKTGRLLLAAPGKLFLSPNGHGGTLTALAENGLIHDLASRGVKHVFYFQVDNPLVKVCDPGFIGRHIATRSEASSKIVAKTDPGEKVGVLVSVNGRVSIVEYTLLPKELAEHREPTGELSYRAGSPAIHLFTLDFLDRVTRTATGSLPYRAAFKAVSHLDPVTGSQLPAPNEPNAIKFERFIFDALPHAERWLAVETARAEEFAPIKNASGPDSAETAQAAQVALHAEWLTRVGIDPQGHLVEISPLFALDPDEFAEKILSQTVTPETMITGPKVFR